MSVGWHSIECMFEPVRSSLLDTFHGVEDAGVVASIGAGAVDENVGCARRLEAMGELYARRAPEDDEERTAWAVDGHQSIVAEICAELNISRGRARGQLEYAIALREKLPQVMAVFKTGVIDMRMVSTMIGRSTLITDPVLMAQLDTKLAAWAPKWMRLSGPKLEARIDWWVERIDPCGRRVPEARAEKRYVQWFAAAAGLAGMYAQLRAADGVAVEQRLSALADSVCPNDPRTRDQRQADALGALAAGLTGLRCECDSADCAGGQRPTGTDVVIHVLAEQCSVEGSGATPGYLSGFGAIPATAVQDLAATAKLKPLIIPDAAAPGEPGYRPSAALAEFVRLRDLTCRFPGCDAPAQVCDIDHTVPWPAGPTHPSNLKLYCRVHHLLKTFWTGAGGWADTQLPDGTVIFTAPSGRTYTTTPGGSLFFPILATPTGEAAIRKLTAEPGEHRGVMMPRRKRTRAEERRARITAERRINEQRLKLQQWLFDELEKRREASAADDPPPF
jgi:hypothetical protein